MAVDTLARPAQSVKVRRLQWLVLAVPVVSFAVAGWTHRFIGEDGFIYLRVVRQIRSGHGPVFNTGERVEAFTGPLWVGMLALGDLVTPVRLEWLAVVLGLAGSTAGIVMAIAGSRRLVTATEDDAAFLLPFGVLVFVVLTPSWLFATSALETGLTFAWLGASLWILARWATHESPRLPTWHAVVLGLGWLVRPDLTLFTVAFALLVIGAQWKRDARDGFRILAAMAALPAAYQVFRMGYYGSLVPNTAIAKEGGNVNFDRGWQYFADFVEPYWLWIPALALLAGGYIPLASALARRGRRRAVGAGAVFLGCGLLHALYVVAVGGDYIHARLLMPSFFAVCAPVAVLPATRRHLAGLVVAPWALVAVFALRPAQYEPDNWLANGFVMVRASGQTTIDDFGWGDGGPSWKWYTGPGFYYQVKGGRARLPAFGRGDQARDRVARRCARSRRHARLRVRSRSACDRPARARRHAHRTPRECAVAHPRRAAFGRARKAAAHVVAGRAVDTGRRRPRPTRLPGVRQPVDPEHRRGRVPRAGCVGPRGAALSWHREDPPRRRRAADARSLRRQHPALVRQHAPPHSPRPEGGLRAVLRTGHAARGSRRALRFDVARTRYALTPERVLHRSSDPRTAARRRVRRSTTRSIRSTTRGLTAAGSTFANSLKRWTLRLNNSV
jgi:hypothetical protein